FGSLAFSPDGSMVASQGDDLRVWERASGRLLAVFDPNRFRSGAPAFAPDGKHLLSAHDDEVLIWDLQSGRHRSLWKPGKRDGATAQRLAFSRDGKTLAIYSKVFGLGKGGRIDLHDYPSGKKRGVITWDDDPDMTGLFFDPHGRLVFDAGEEVHV